MTASSFDHGQEGKFGRSGKAQACPVKSGKGRVAVEEAGGNHYSDLAEAQKAALPELARDLAGVLRGLLSSGELIVRDGKIVINPDSNLGKLNE